MSAAIDKVNSSSGVEHWPDVHDLRLPHRAAALSGFRCSQVSFNACNWFHENANAAMQLPHHMHIFHNFKEPIIFLDAQYG
jgi:hypothetical protein